MRFVYLRRNEGTLPLRRNVLRVDCGVLRDGHACDDAGVNDTYVLIYSRYGATGGQPYLSADELLLVSRCSTTSLPLPRQCRL